MFLKHCIYVNWGNIPNLEFEFGPVNLFSGGNGSGKTTAADAIQTIMTAAHENLFQFNPGQDETTQRGRGGKRVRTLASYVLGCDDGSYARLDPSDGYLAAVFHPTQGETAPPFTAVMGVRAWLDLSGNNTVARQDDLLFLILPDVQLALNHFVREDKGDKYVVPLDRVQALLIKEFGKRSVEKYDTKKAYLRRLYGALRGRDDAVAENEAVAAAKAFSRFMAYKPVQSIDRFVAEEILERKDLGEAIRSISSQLKTIHAMERDAAKLVDSIAILDSAKLQSQLYIENWIELNTLDYTLAQHGYVLRQHDYLSAKKEQSRYRSEIEANSGNAEHTAQRLRQIHTELVTLEAQRMGIGALQQKDALVQQRQDNDGKLVEHARTLLVQGDQLQTNITHTQAIVNSLADADWLDDLPGIADLNTLTLGRQVLEDGKRGDIDLHALMQRDITGDLAELEHYLGNARKAQQLHNQWWNHWHDNDVQTSLRDALARAVQQRETRCGQLENQRRQKTQEIERLRVHQVNYPAHVERAIAAIQQQCPKADPRVLCDHVEVKDPRWQAAIEGYLGGARFSILVEPTCEAQAISIVRRLPGRDNNARIIQGSRARQDAGKVTLSAESIVHVLEFTHATANDHLIASYGSVQRVESAEALRMTRRGVTADGMASGSYSMWRCDLSDGDLVFGAAARERALAAKEQELQGILVDWQVAQDRLQQARALLEAVDGLQTLTYADTITAMLEIHRELRKLENLLAQLDLGEHQHLEQQLHALQAEAQTLRDQEGALNRRQGELNNKLTECTRRCQHLNDQKDENRLMVERCEANLRAIATVWPDFDVEARLITADNDAQNTDRQIAENHRREIEARLHTSERKMSEAVEAHNQQCRPGDAIAYVTFDGLYDERLFATVCGLQRDVDRVYNVLKNNILVEKHQQLAQLKDSFNNAFVTHLCHAIYQAINEGRRQIELLNKELQHHRFGSDQESFRFDHEWVPEFRDYARFFEEVIKHPVLGDGVALFEAELSPRSKKVRGELMAMLLDEDEQRAFRELERIADYRNYRRYEIYKEVEGKPPIALSEYGTGSGGQLETPAYIIRAAAVTSAFRFAEGNNHLRMVLVDEAFSKMDETRSREVINYLTKTLGLQLIFIMPTSKCGPYMDLISNEFVFAKCPSDTPRGQLQTRVFVDRKQCDQERIQALWANHRRTIYHQAELDFMEEILEQTRVDYGSASIVG